MGTDVIFDFHGERAALYCTTSGEAIACRTFESSVNWTAGELARAFLDYIRLSDIEANGHDVRRYNAHEIDRALTHFSDHYTGDFPTMEALVYGNDDQKRLALTPGSMRDGVRLCVDCDEPPVTVLGMRDVHDSASAFWRLSCCGRTREAYPKAVAVLAWNVANDFDNYVDQDEFVDQDEDVDWL